MDIDKSRVKKLVLNRSTVRKLGTTAVGSVRRGPPTEFDTVGRMGPPTEFDTVARMGPPTKPDAPDYEPLAPPTHIPPDELEPLAPPTHVPPDYEPLAPPIHIPPGIERKIDPDAPGRLPPGKPGTPGKRR